MHVLVTGGMGFVGYAVATVLVDAGHEVTVLSHTGRTQPRPDTTRVLQADIRDVVTLKRAFKGQQFDGVCHLAGLAQVRESFKNPLHYFEVNVEGTVNLVRALTETIGTPAVVFGSTAAIYGSHAEGHLTEQSPAEPDNPYAASKYAAELVLQQCAQTGLIGATTLRCFAIGGATNHVGDPDMTRILPKALNVAAGHEPTVTVNGDGSAVREFTHVLDVAEAFRLALVSTTVGNYRMFNVGSGEAISVRDLVHAVMSRTGRSVAVEHRPPRPEPHTLIADSARIRTELGWHSPTSSLDRLIDDAWMALIGEAPTGQTRAESSL